MVNVVSSVTRLCRETDPVGRAFVDVFLLRDVLIEHCGVVARTAKALDTSVAAPAANLESLRVSLLGISSAIMELLVKYAAGFPVKCAKCSKLVSDDSILCEGERSCRRWFHRSCVGLHQGSFRHVGWLCGVSPCQGVRLAFCPLPSLLTCFACRNNSSSSASSARRRPSATRR